MTRTFGIFIFAMIAAGGCDDSLECTLQIEYPLLVRIVSDGLHVDEITVRNGDDKIQCMRSGISQGDAGFVMTARCTEVGGGGTYHVRVRSGSLHWTQSVEIDGNECHSIGVKEVEFVLDPATAD